MTKMLVILLIGLVFESAGIVFLKKGMNQLGEVRTVSAGEIWRVVKAGATNASILLGVFFQALFFACLLVLMSKNDISFLWPMTSLTFVFSTLSAMMFLHERVSSTRWFGVAFIMIGAALITLSEKKNEAEKSAAKPAPSASAAK